MLHAICTRSVLSTLVTASLWLLLTGCSQVPQQSHSRSLPPGSQYPGSTAPNTGNTAGSYPANTYPGQSASPGQSTSRGSEAGDTAYGQTAERYGRANERREQADEGRAAPPPTYNRPRPASQAPRAATASSGALGSLLEQAKRAYGQGNYTSAIATAERGLRIDRRSAGLYLVLAQSYLALAEPGQAEQFANQGLRFSTSGTQEAQALEAVRQKAAQRR